MQAERLGFPAKQRGINRRLYAAKVPCKEANQAVNFAAEKGNGNMQSLNHSQKINIFISYNLKLTIVYSIIFNTI